MYTYKCEIHHFFKGGSMKKPKFLFGDTVVVATNELGLVVKTYWSDWSEKYHYEVYNRMSGTIKDYWEEDIERYSVRHKYLDENELAWQNL